MSTLPSPPFILIPGIHNLRTIGAHPTASGKVTRSTYIYRSGAPTTPLPPTSIPLLSLLHLTTSYDLRSVPEINRLAASPPAPLPHTTRVFAPVFQDQDYSPERIAKRYANYSADGGPGGFVRAYGDILESGVEAFRAVFEHVLRRPGENFLVHCTAGKDRTGVLVALILGVAGVGDGAVVAEYGLTEVGLQGWREVIVGFLMAEEGTGMTREGVERMVGAREENMTATLEMIGERYGGAVGYVRDKLGFSSEEIEVIKSHLVEDAVP